MSTSAVVVGGREVVLEGLSGPGMGKRFEIPGGTTGTVGRTAKSKFVIPNDPRLAEAHFEVATAGGSVTLKDLDSGFGTHVNAKRTRLVALNNGDVVTAGSSTFRVRIQTPETWPDITPAEYALVSLLYGSGERVFALVDAAREDRAPAFLQACDAEHSTLLEGPRAQQLKSAAPYIVEVPRGSKILKLLVREGWGKSWTVYLAAWAPMGQLLSHLQRFNTYQAPSGQHFFYRYYDPRVLRNALATSSPADRQRFFGPITRFIMEDADSGTALEYRTTMPAVNRVVLS